uniref:Cytochrome c oxidase subunit 3 n=1 Tax=Pleonexes koreana TaxID=2663336 RepID=A0A5P9W7U2_9CRUS|nr:cytochrome c oxidase subunit III [Pleonexes koreana]
MTNTMNHPYHLVEKSPWPLTASIGAMMMTTGLVKWFHLNSVYLMLSGLILILMSSYQWWRDISREGFNYGFHSCKVMTGLRWGMILFITSEIMFFFSFFWAFFHSTLSVVMEIGGQWPPVSIMPFNPFQIPLLNTIILLSSGVTVTWAHHSMIENNHSQTEQALLLTILLGIIFTALQAMEYMEASFTIADSVYGSTFFVATGFHGLHVIIGSIFLFVMLIRHMNMQFSKNHHLGFEASIWYWHFVDVVWLFLYSFIYWWSY